MWKCTFISCMISIATDILFFRDIHPSAVLSQIYFENMFCLQPFATVASTSSQALSLQRSEMGIKVALGDSSA